MNYTLPGLIDIHVHLRDPGQTHKEDFYTGTSSALAGGFSTVLDMPNNPIPITTEERLEEKIKTAREKIVCNTGFYFGSLGDNFEEFPNVQDKVFGLKLYLNVTTGNFLIDVKKFEQICNNWPKKKPILLHAEEDIIEEIMAVVRRTRNRIHICHVSSTFELQTIMRAKEEGLPVTCGVTPHHLFLTRDDEAYLGSFALMKPRLKTKADKEFLWNNINAIDIVESDHAPHTKKEKESEKEYFGVPGLETTLPLLLQAEKEGKISRDTIIRMLFNNPAQLFRIPTDADTKVEIDDSPFEIDNKHLKTKCAWSPFHGWKARGKVQRVFLRGEKVFEGGEILVNPGFANVILYNNDIFSKTP